jgi:glycosyltransferase involved in cell wall biosynthesis
LDKKLIKVLLIGPISPPITGNSMVNDLVLEKLNEKNNFYLEVINRAFPVFNESIGVFSFRKVFFYIKQYIESYKILKSDIVYVAIGLTFFGVLKDSPFIILAKLLRKKVVIHVHGNYLKTQYSRLYGVRKKVFYYILSRADAGIVSSKLLKGNLTPFLINEKIFYVPYFVEDDIVNAVSENDVVNINNGLRILFLSNLMKEKGILDLLKALNILNDRDISYKAKIIGGIDNDYKSEIMKYIKNNNDIEYFDPVRGKEKINAYLWSNVFVLPTYYSMEGQPISLLEAMYTGNLIITTNHAGILGICSDKNGIIVKKKAPKDIADNLEKIANNIGEHKGIMKYNHSYTKNNFKTVDFIDRLKRVFYKQKAT